ncbi:MAG: GYD domain-containing protein [Acidobacteriota bacterium]
MPKFVLMTRLSPESVLDSKVRRAMGRAWLNKVKNACPEINWLAHYAILGPYDFMDIYEAPTIEAAHKVSLITRAEGAVSAESWQALPYDDFIELLEEVET